MSYEILGWSLIIFAIIGGGALLLEAVLRREK